jgi:hypothetical protein
MTNSTNSVNGGAMSKVNCTAIMTRAWAIFRQTYCFPASSFPASAATASTLTRAKHGQRPNQPIRIAATSVETKADRITTLYRRPAFGRFNDHWAICRITAMRAQIFQLSG